MREKEPVVEVEAEVVEETPTADPKKLPYQAASALEAVADTVSVISKEHGEKIRHKAEVVRKLADNTQAAVVAGKTFVDSVKETADRLGLKIEMQNRRGAPRRPYAR